MPNPLHRLRARLRNRHFDADLAEELRLHEELKREELEASGIAPADARSEARRALGEKAIAMARLFKQKTGQSPGEWRRSARTDAKPLKANQGSSLPPGSRARRRSGRRAS
jgi:hypothetical protein